MRKGVQVALGIMAVGAVGASGYFLGARTKSPTFTSSLDAFPEGALLVATADAGVMRRSGVMAPLFSEAREIPGLGKVRDVCGFDPMDNIVELGVGIPANGADGDFGLVAAGAIDPEALLACASKVIEARGGRPVVNPIGAFRTVRDAGASASTAEIAVRPGGPVLLGAGAYLRAMIDAADGRMPRVSSDPLHTRLSRDMGGGSIRITIALTPEQRRTLNEELARGGAQGSPAASMIGLGLAVSLETRVGLSGVVACETAEPCTALGKLFDTRRASAGEDLLVRVLGVAPILERMKISTEGARIDARVDMSPDEATDLVKRLIVLRHAMVEEDRKDSLVPQGPAPAPVPPSPSASATLAPR